MLYFECFQYLFARFRNNKIINIFKCTYKKNKGIFHESETLRSYEEMTGHAVKFYIYIYLISSFLVFAIVLTTLLYESFTIVT